MTRFTNHVLSLTLGIALATGSPVLAQSAGDPGAADSSTTEPSSTWMFDAGIDIQPGSRDAGGHSKAIAPGGWISVGSARLRLQVDYSHHEARYMEPDIYRSQGISTWITDAVGVTGVWRFRTDRRLSPHVLAGVAWERRRGHSCFDSLYERRCSTGDAIVHSVPANSGLSLIVRDHDLNGQYGAGIDVTLGSRFFVRAQIRAYTDPDQYFPLLADSSVFIGGGVRF